MNRLNIQKTSLGDLYTLQRKPIADERGFLERVFCFNELETYIKKDNIRQINHTLTKDKGVVRGMHFQKPPYSEKKIVSCIRGEVFDVAVDLRKNSPTFLKYFGITLSGDNFKSLIIPEGFAHGFQTLTRDCEMLYFHTADFKSDAEEGIDALDPVINIDWPLNISERSLRDASHDKIHDSFSGVDLNGMS